MEAIIEKAKTRLDSARLRFESRREVQKEKAKADLETRLANFDVYVKNVIDSKIIKLATATSDRKKTRIQDEVAFMRIHYDKVRKSMIESAESRMTVYKTPAYLVEAEREYSRLTAPPNLGPADWNPHA